MSKQITLTKYSKELVYLSSKDPHLEYAIDIVGEISYSLHEDPYEFLVEAIIGQMLSNKVADVLTGRVNELCGGKIQLEKIISLNEEELRNCGISKAKIGYIFILSNFIAENPTYFKEIEEKTDDEIMKSLTSLKGIGVWTAKMYLIFVLGREDVLPHEDGAFVQAYAWLYQFDSITTREIKKNCVSWAPFSSIAARYLYQVLDMGFTKTDNELYK